MSHFINERSSLVTESIDGMLAASGGRLARLDGFPHTKVILRTDWDKSRVALIAGGGSGHEPSHAGFIGEGMLTAVVCGEVFASPSVDAVLSAIVAVTGQPGCLLIVKNYTGDRLNFGLAAERARQLGHRVEIVFVADDVALPDAPHPRGVAGTLLVHKAAGHTAALGAALADVRAAAQDVADAVVSLGLALGTCTLPGEAAQNRLSSDRAELGLGIHGEPGARVITVAEARDLVAMMVKELAQKLEERRSAAGNEAPAEGALAVLVNNLGGTTPLEMNVIVRELGQSAIAARLELMIGPGALMTALDMHGFSLSLLPLNAGRRAALVSAVTADAWPGVRKMSAPTVIPLPMVTATAYRGSDSPVVRSMVGAICEALLQNEAALNSLDRAIGDGDTGTTFATAGRTLLEAMKRGELPLADPGQLCEALGNMLSRTMGGSSGVLLSIFFTATGGAIRRGAGVAEAFGQGLDRMQAYGGARPGDRTMIDALTPAIAALSRANLPTAAAAARGGAESTATMTKAKAGRSSYLDARNLIGVPDPGAIAVAIAFEAAERCS